MKRRSEWAQRANARCRWIVAVVGLLGSRAVSAALPTAVDPSTAPASGDWLGVVEGYIKDGGLVIGLAVSVVGFVWVAWSALAKFNEARVGKAEWGEVGLLGGVGAAILLLVTFLLTQAAGVI